ncbi:hypothetical protein [Pueribacillus sp. YX66]|uniref:hypothetical protein n=1 Tax=Pueribacillus sp. YX66 TaxID=3229242 RepID=UPI00358D987C
MNKKRQNITILIVLLVLSSIGGLAYWLWVKSIALPMLGEIDKYEAETVSDESYTIEDGKIKLITIAESGCPSDCQDMFARLDPLQQDLIDEKAFVARAVMLTIVEDEADKPMFKSYLEKYNVDENGWKILILPEQQRTEIINSIKKSKEDERKLTLVDANGKIRQHYNIEVEEEKEQLLKDVSQLIRIQQQSIEERR